MSPPGPGEDHIKFDPSQSGLRKFLSEPEENILRFVWTTGEYGVDSASAMRVVLERLPPGETISRATVIHYLNRMVDRGVLGAREVTGKGGHRKIYFPLLDEKGFTMHAIRALFQSVLEDFPGEARGIVEELTELRRGETLRTTIEELERTGDELQAANEELASLNEELENRNTTLSQVSNDLVNLIKSTNLPIIIVDRDLVIRDITPQAVKRFNLISSDVGRPIGDINLDVEVDDVELLISEVIRSGEDKEFEVGGSEGRWYTLQLRPYLTEDSEVDGATVLFVDITARKQAENETKRANERFKDIADRSIDVIYTVDKNGFITYASPAVETLTGYSPEEIIAKHFTEMMPESQHAPTTVALDEAFKGDFRESYQTEITRKDGTRAIIEVNSPPILQNGEIVGMQGIIRDITERKRSEETLRQSELRYRSLFESSHEGILISGPDGRLESVNPAAAEICGYDSPDEMIGKPAAECWANLEQRAEVFETLKETGYITDHEVEIRRKDGSNGLVLTSAILYKSDDGGILRTEVFFRDITKRNQMEEELRISENRWRTLVENAPDGIITMDLKGTVTSINPAFSKHTGRSRDDIVGKHFTKLGTLRVRDVPKYVKMWSSMVKGKDIPTTEFVYRRKDGSEGIGEAHGGMVTFEGGKREILLVLREVSARKQMEDDLRFQSQILGAATDSILAFSTDGIVVYANEVWSETFGFTREETIGKHIEDIVAQEFRSLLDKRRTKLMKSGDVTIESGILTKDGSTVPVEVHSRMIDLGEKRYIISVARDKTERRRLEKELKKSKEK